MENTHPAGMAKHEPKLRVRDYFVILGWAVFAALLLKTFVVDAYRIPTRSMEQTLLPGDFVLVNKLVYGGRTPSHLPLTSYRIPRILFPSLAQPRAGDVLAFEFPGEGTMPASPPQTYLKRVVAVPGDTLAIASGTLLINGRPVVSLAEGDTATTPAAATGTTDGAPARWIDHLPGSPLVVPGRGSVLDLGRGHLPRWRSLIEREGHHLSVDSGGCIRIDGLPSESYTVERNHYFVLGDNRNDSFDSRAWGLLPDDGLIGKAMLVYWSRSESPGSGDFVERLRSIRWNRIGILVR